MRNTRQNNMELVGEGTQTSSHVMNVPVYTAAGCSPS